MTTQQPEVLGLADWLEAIGAGGVSGPLVGQPQAMPDLSQLTERGAAAWAGVDAQGLRDGGASPSANAGEPVAWLVCTEEGDPDMVFLDRLEACQYCEDDDPPKPLYLAAPPTAQAGGWMPIETAPKDGTEILLHAPACDYKGTNVKARTTYGHWRAPSDTPRIKYQDGFAPEPEWEDFEPFWASWDGGFTEEHPPTHWMPLPPPPTSAEGVEHG